MLYEQIKNTLIAKYKWSDEEFERNLENARQWHNPLNYDRGEPIKARLKCKYLFTEALKAERMGKRIYFDFHAKKEELKDIDATIRLFMNCNNWPRYVRVWKKYAPRGCNTEGMYLLAVATMTTSGMLHEAKVVKQLVADGHTVEHTFMDEDLRGDDIILDGKPRQIKSPKTAAVMRRMGNHGIL